MRLRAIAWLILSMALSASVVRAQLAATTALTVIRAGVIIDGQSDTVRKNQLIFVRGEAHRENNGWHGCHPSRRQDHRSNFLHSFARPN